MDTTTIVRPLTLLQDVGVIVAVVAVGGTVFYFLKGVISSSSKGRRLAGGAKGVVAHAPCVARSAGWCGVAMAITGGMEHVSGVECQLNSVVAFAGASALFSARQGPRAAARSGLKAAAFAAAMGTTLYGVGCLLENFLGGGN